MKEWQSSLNSLISSFILSEIKFSDFSSRFTKIYIDEVDDALLGNVSVEFQELYSEVNDIIEFTDIKASDSDRKQYGVTNIDESREKIKKLLKKLDINFFSLSL